MTITLSPDQEQIASKAIRAGLIDTPGQLVDLGVETIRVRLESQATQPERSADEWIREFRSWVQSHPTDTPLLSDEAVDRESIYGTRGL